MKQSFTKKKKLLARTPKFKRKTHVDANVKQVPNAKNLYVYVDDAKLAYLRRLFKIVKSTRDETNPFRPKEKEKFVNELPNLLNI